MIIYDRFVHFLIVQALLDAIPASLSRTRRARLSGLGAFMLLTLWMCNLFGVVVVLAWGAALVALACRRKASGALSVEPAGES